MLIMFSPLLKLLGEFVGTAGAESSELCNVKAASVAAPENFGNAASAPIFFKSDSAPRTKK